MSRNATTLAVLGAGAWGTAVGQYGGAAHAKVWLWAHDPAHVEAMRADPAQRRRLPGVALAAKVEPVADIACVGEADHVLAVVPPRAFARRRTPCAAICARIGCGQLRQGHRERSRPLYARGACRGSARPARGRLSGPSFAVDLARGLPTAVTLAAEQIELAEYLCARLAAPHFRLYRSSDLVGVEIGGAAKNVLAIACGVAWAANSAPAPMPRCWRAASPN